MAAEIVLEEVVGTELVEAKAGVIASLAGAFLTEVEALGPITTDAEDLMQKEIQAGVKKALADWEVERKSLTDPLEKVKKDIIAKYRTVAEPATKALAILNQRILDRWRDKEAAQKKEQARQDALAAKRLERATVKAEEKGEPLPEPIIPMPAIAQPAKTTHTSQGRVTVAQYWTCRYTTTEAEAVKAAIAAGRPDLLSFNELAAKAAVRAGVREIPGMVVYQDLKV